MVLFPPPFYFIFDISNLLSYISSYELARPIMGTIFLVNIYIWTPRSITLPRSRCACGVTTLTKNNVSSMQYNLTYDCQSVENGQTRKADYYFEQLEHGGGGCNCVDIDFICDQQNRYELLTS